MPEWLSKIFNPTESLGLGRHLVGPLIAASYIANTGLSYDRLSLDIPQGAAFSDYWLSFLAILLIKTAQALILFYFPVAILKELGESAGPDWLRIFGALGVTFGFCGLFMVDDSDFLKSLHPSTYYVAIIAGLYLISESWSARLSAAKISEY